MLRKTVSAFQRYVLFAVLFASAAMDYPVQATPARLRIVVLGDSISEGYGIEKSLSWPKIMETELAKSFTPPPEVINAGISGSTSASAPARLKWLMKGKIDLLVLALGGNDGLRGVIPQETRKNLEATIAVAESAKIPTVLAGMMLPPNYGVKYTKEFKQIFPDLARMHHLTLVPFLLEGVGGEKSLNQADGIHPNEKGHQIVAGNVLKVVVPELQKLEKAAGR